MLLKCFTWLVPRLCLPIWVCFPVPALIVSLSSVLRSPPNFVPSSPGAYFPTDANHCFSRLSRSSLVVEYNPFIIYLKWNRGNSRSVFVGNARPPLVESRSVISLMNFNFTLGLVNIDNFDSVERFVMFSNLSFSFNLRSLKAKALHESLGGFTSLFTRHVALFNFVVKIKISDRSCPAGSYYIS